MTFGVTASPVFNAAALKPTPRSRLAGTTPTSPVEVAKRGGRRVLTQTRELAEACVGRQGPEPHEGFAFTSDVRPDHAALPMTISQ